ncbi:MAG TPA: ABC transporter permease [Candidatus Dormibacteraeota bacterium]|nr:ABC transporter permease [Candidatus Dormibacteraeota bacterium]
MKPHTNSGNQKKKRSKLINRIPNSGWMTISVIVALIFWYILSLIPSTSRSFPNIFLVTEAIGTMIERGVFWHDITSSLISVSSGFAIGFVLSLPVAALMAWYRPIQYVVEPWIQFVRNIPPLAYVPLVVISAGVGRTPQVIVITIATFLIMTITIYQGVKNINPTLVKAARVLGARDRDIFMKIIAPASLPFIITAMRLGTAVGLTSLIAAESTGAQAGLGMRIRALSNTFEASPMLLYIIIIGIIGLIFEWIVKVLERRLTGWQEKSEG